MPPVIWQGKKLFLVLIDALRSSKVQKLGSLHRLLKTRGVDISRRELMRALLALEVLGLVRVTRISQDKYQIEYVGP
ncbi:hypothetical protein DRN94_000985 [archaeon]|nr:hypothetical protein [archaeon]